MGTNRTALPDRVRHECRRLKRLCAPELSMVYLLAAAELDGVLPRASYCDGWQTNFSPILRQHLIDRGEWHGRWPIVVLDVEHIRNTASDLPVTAETLLLQTYLHELGHCLPFVRMPEVRSEPTPEALERARNEHAKWAGSISNPVPWAWHGLQFTRTALHLHYRATAGGFTIPLDGLCAGWGYAMSPAWEYADALGSETEKMMGASFDEIKNTTPPESFTALFKRNCENYFHFHPIFEKTKCQAAC